jgi:hypothetical protein
MRPVTRHARGCIAAAVAMTVGVLALTLAALALGAFTQVAKVTLTAHRSGRSTGVTVYVAASDPTAHQPRSVRRLVITFPAGTRFDLASTRLKTCRLTDKQLTTAFGPVCPRASRVGTGTVSNSISNGFPLSADAAHVSAYDRGTNRLVLVVRPVLSSLPVEIIHASVSGAKLTIVVPRLIYGKLAKVVLASLKLFVPALGSGHDALITVGRCTKGKFTFRERFTYADHAPVELGSSSACT